ncbi:MAG: hypothetical protein PVI23_04940 [Maricaulaceae bacterium]|jgi:hypothetical protein
MRLSSTFLLGALGVAALSACSADPAEAAGQCITYEQTGGLSGQVIECGTNLATTYTIETLELNMLGVTQSQNRHTIRKNGEIISWDLDTLQGTRTDDPMADVVDGDPEEVAQAFISAMGFSPTGETKSIVGETCEVYASAQMGQACLTPDLLLLEQVLEGMGPASFTRTAVALDRSSSGDPANYEVPDNVTIQQIDLGGFGLPSATGGSGGDAPGLPAGVDLNDLINGALGGNN